MRFLIAVVVAGTLLVAGACWYWLNAPLELAGPSVDLSIDAGATPREVVEAVREAGVVVRAPLLYWWFRLSGQSRQIRAGSYVLDATTTPRSLLRKLVRGEESLRSVTLVEGWTFRQMREALGKAEQLRADTQGLSDDAVMARLGRPDVAAEGRFFPDTYTYSKGVSDLSVLLRALHAMDRNLATAWSQRDLRTPLADPDQALVLASIVEKETGAAGDRARIAAVFCNRLRVGMRLQTDPTVIYGLGERYRGALRKADLLADSPWNTYTRDGLPPTPISSPGKAALRAAVRPADTPALYFVARGDGSSEFSTSLDAHNRAVNKFLRNP